jgi:sulfide:quinone oxidoreductase
VQPKKIHHKLSVSTQITPEDYAQLAASGVRAIINNRPDNEDPGQMPASEAAKLAARHGLAYHHIPITLADIPADAVRRFGEAVEQSAGPVHAHCRSGMRSALLWALHQVQSGQMTAEEACAAASAHGFDLREPVTRHGAKLKHS